MSRSARRSATLRACGGDLGRQIKLPVEKRLGSRRFVQLGSSSLRSREMVARQRIFSHGAEQYRSTPTSAPNRTLNVRGYGLWQVPMRWLLIISASAALAAIATAMASSALESRDDSGALEKFARPADIPFPSDNSFTEQKYQLGRLLFFDTSLSRSQTLACASCHNPEASWTDGRARAQGEGPAPLPLRSPTLLNVAWTQRLGWDGKFRDLEAVAFAPITGKANMNLSEGELIARLESNPQYRAKFAAAFDDGAINRRNIELAIATFERTIVSKTSAFDRWVNGDDTAVSGAAKRGFRTFTGKGHCSECHSDWNFTDGSFHDIGVATGDDIGRGKYFPSSEKLRYAFKTPSLRNVTRRAPYMHDGSVATLEDVIDLYDKGGIDRPSRAEFILPLNLTANEKADLIAFLATLDDETVEVGVRGALEPDSPAISLGN